MRILSALLIFISNCVFFGLKTHNLLTLSFNKPVEFNGLKFILADVLSDTRCPENVVCKWEGRVDFIIKVIKDKDTTELLVAKPKNKRVKLYFYDFCIEIIDVLPHRRSTLENIKREKYKVIFELKNVEKENNRGKEIKFENFKKGIYCNFTEKKDFVIDNKEDFLNLLSKVSGKISSLPSQIDFDKYILIATFMGQKSSGGYEIKIEKIVEFEKEIKVFVKEIIPGKNCIVTMALTQPYHIVKIKKSYKRIKFYHETYTRNCK